MTKNKPRWKRLPMYEYVAKRCRQYGISDDTYNRIKEKAKKMEGVLYESEE